MWSCSPCVVLLLSAVLGREARATEVGKRQKDLLHRVDKVQAQVTAFPKKRDATVCPSSYDLCPASLNGGCCPPRYGCSTDACYATTAGAQTACGLPGYYNCGVSAGGGCCPEGYICGSQCTPPVGASTSCPASYYLCPSSFNYGCCKSGYGCATNGCYVTTPSTATYTLTAVATNAGGQTVTTTRTATTVMSPTPPTALPTTSDANAIPKFIPTSVSKIPATSSSSSSPSSGGGLTKAQLGGIIGGAILILLIVLIAAFWIIRRLKGVSDADDSAAAKTSSSGGTTRPPNMAQYGRPGEIDGVGYDPLMMSTPVDTTTSSAVGTPHTLGGMRNRSDSDYSQPTATPYHVSGTPSDGPRHPSMDSGYFDIPARVHNVPGRVSMVRSSVDSRGALQQHNRQWSDASELSNGGASSDGGVGSPLIPAELDIAGGFIPELPSAEDVVSPADGGRGGGRRWSGGSGGSTVAQSPRPSLNSAAWRHSSSSSGVGAGVGMGGLPSPSGGMTGTYQVLDPVSESSEVMHGYYGPRRGQVGQTAAGLDIEHDITTPGGVGFR